MVCSSNQLPPITIRPYSHWHSRKKNVFSKEQHGYRGTVFLYLSLTLHLLTKLHFLDALSKKNSRLSATGYRGLRQVQLSKAV